MTSIHLRGKGISLDKILKATDPSVRRTKVSARAVAVRQRSPGGDSCPPAGVFGNG